MPTIAELTPTKQGWAVIVMNSSGTEIQWPILYDNGKVVYDRPEDIPKSLKPKIYRLLVEANRRNNNQQHIPLWKKLYGP
jgi:hypothetical protein